MEGAPEPSGNAGLGWIGRLVIAVIVLPGLALGALTGFGLLWFVLYAGVGAILAIRRPATSIGWLLIAIGWALDIAALGGTDVSGLPSVIVPLASALESFATHGGWPLVFGLFAVLGVVLPDGRLPAGRWRVPALLVAAAAMACAVVAVIVPDLSDVMIPPMILALAGSATVLLARRARAHGIERQQLRWIVSSVVLVVVMFVVSLVIATLVPAADTSGGAWVPIAIAFPLVPVAIGIAVLRYRLYDIDTVINRAVLYGLLTAVLAGGSAAVVGVTQKLFSGIVGSGSDASIVVTTIVVVAAFDPVKKRLQAIVDRRFRPALDPAAAVAALVADLRTWPSELSLDRTLRRLLTVSVAAWDARGGSVEVEGGVPMRLVQGASSGRRTLKASAVGASVRATVTLYDPAPGAAGPDSLTTGLVAVLREVTGEAVAAVAVAPDIAVESAGAAVATLRSRPSAAPGPEAFP